MFIHSATSSAGYLSINSAVQLLCRPAVCQLVQLSVRPAVNSFSYLTAPLFSRLAVQRFIHSATYLPGRSAVSFSGRQLIQLFSWLAAAPSSYLATSAVLPPLRLVI